MLAARAGVVGVFEGPGGEAADLDHAVGGLAVQGGKHLEEGLPVEAELLGGVVHGRFVAPGGEVEEEGAAGDEVIEVGERVDVPA